MDKIARRRKISRGLLLLALLFYIAGAIFIGWTMISGQYTATVGAYAALLSFFVFMFIGLPGFLLSPSKSAYEE
jgi:F0F1-type ATP synthase assembly protein I